MNYMYLEYTRLYVFLYPYFRRIAVLFITKCCQQHGKEKCSFVPNWRAIKHGNL